MNYPSDFTAEIAKKPICGVLSTATIAGVSFAYANNLYKKNLMRGRKRHGGRTSHEQRCVVLTLLGVRYKEIPVTSRKNLRYTVENLCKPGVTYMITTSSHVVTVRDGIVQDQDEQSSFVGHGARLCFVRHILQIEK